MVTSYKPYSVALFELAKEIDKVAFYLEELESLTTIWNENDDFKKALRHPKITRLQKREWISQLFEKELDSMLYRFLLVMIEHDVIGYIPEIKDAYIEVYKEDLNIETVRVESAVVLSDEQLENIKKMIESKLNKSIELDVSVVPELIAGVRVRTKDLVLDNTLLSRINHLKEKLDSTN